MKFRYITIEREYTEAEVRRSDANCQKSVEFPVMEGRFWRLWRKKEGSPRTRSTGMRSL